LGGDELSYFRNRFIGFVFQFHYLLPEFSAIENIMMPGLIALGQKKAGQGSALPNYSDLSDRAGKLLEELGLYDRKDHKPGELSGGEQQRVAVARALLMEPGVVFADEPTGNLDTATGEELFRLLLDINAARGTTFVIVTHNESLSSKCHRILEMKDGILGDRPVR
jgi:lipoprotein-releasing system ATP-binding protein